MISILTGGESAEREVSLASAKTVAGSLERLGIEFSVLDLKNVDWLKRLETQAPEVALLAIHGSFGEDGGLQGILEGAGISYTGTTSAVSALAFDKRRTKDALLGSGISLPRERALPMEFFVPVVIKPNAQGSSVGVSLVKEAAGLNAAVAAALEFGPDILVEELVEGRELSCAVTDLYGTVQALPVVEIKPGNAYFDYDSKYIPGMSQEICPAEIGEQATRVVQRLSKEIFGILGIRQYCRIDWILSGDTPYFLEVNTIPGMTPTSLINKEIAAPGLSFDDFIARLVRSA